MTVCVAAPVNGTVLALATASPPDLFTGVTRNSEMASPLLSIPDAAKSTTKAPPIAVSVALAVTLTGVPGVPPDTPRSTSPRTGNRPPGCRRSP